MAINVPLGTSAINRCEPWRELFVDVAAASSILTVTGASGRYCGYDHPINTKEVPYGYSVGSFPEEPRLHTIPSTSTRAAGTVLYQVPTGAEELGSFDNPNQPVDFAEAIVREQRAIVREQRAIVREQRAIVHWLNLWTHLTAYLPLERESLSKTTCGKRAGSPKAKQAVADINANDTADQRSATRKLRTGPGLLAESQVYRQRDSGYTCEA